MQKLNVAVKEFGCAFNVLEEFFMESGSSWTHG